MKDHIYVYLSEKLSPSPKKRKQQGKRQHDQHVDKTRVNIGTVTFPRWKVKQREKDFKSDVEVAAFCSTVDVSTSTFYQDDSRDYGMHMENWELTRKRNKIRKQRLLFAQECGLWRSQFQKIPDSGGGDCGLSRREVVRWDLELGSMGAAGKAAGAMLEKKMVLQRNCTTTSLPCKQLDQTKSQNNHQSQIFTKYLLKEIPVVKKQCKLVEEEFHCPKVPVIRGKINTMFLEGIDKEVQLGAAKLEKPIEEKIVKLPADLILFIKSSRAISKYRTLFQSFRSPVSIDVGSDLVLSSVSSGDLDEALAAIVRDLGVEIVKLQGAVAVPPEFDRMKKILIKAKNKENYHELSVDISFIPGSSGNPATKVRLVGYSENVSKLTEVLHDFQMNQVTTQETINLLYPEMVDCFDKILDLIGMKQTKVTLKASHFPNPCMFVSGPRCHVQEAKQALMSALSSLTLDTLALDGPGAQQYFKAEGKVSKELVESSCCVIIQEKQDVVAPKVSIRSHASNPITIAPQPSITRWCSKTLVGSKTSLEIKAGSLMDKKYYHDSYRHLNSNMNQGSQVSVPQLLPRVSVNTGLSILCTTSQRSVFLFLGLCRKSVDDAMTKLKQLYQAHCSTKNISKDDLADLTQDEIKDLQQLVETQGLHVQENQRRDGGLIVSGLKDGVTELMQMLQAIALLRREVQVREEDDLYTRVAWCIHEHNGSWERLPKTANHNLEKHNVTKGIVDAQGVSWSVNLQKMKAKRHKTGEKTKLKRLENRPDFSLPLYWDNMGSGENLKVVVLDPSSAEYLTIKKAFTKTVQKTVMKIKRLQNIHLRQGYDVLKKKLSEKNKQEGGAGEKLLYHGTSQDSCDSIIKNGFNRSFSGKNATSYGDGTYFAVNASYSAHPTYSKPAADGSQAVFVAQVLTGIYTQGHSGMKMPPPRNNQADDRFDSVVDRIDNPKMFVVFSDNQAYPDYLITFC